MENMIVTIKPFSIVSAPYTDLTGSVKTFASGVVQRGLFLVFREDELGNLLACKLTSQLDSKFLNEFCFVLSSKQHPFLRTDSAVQCDKIHTLFANNCTVLGQVHPGYRLAILRKLDKVLFSVDNSLKDNIKFSTTYSSPNRGYFNE